MLTNRTCQERTKQGDRCRQPPLRDRDLCFWHSPDHADEAAEARRLGGLRRRRERTVTGAYDVEALDTVAGIRRILEIATFDALGMEQSVARVRLLIAAGQALTRLLETGELEELLDQFRRALGHRLIKDKRR